MMGKYMKNTSYIDHDLFIAIQSDVPDYPKVWTCAIQVAL